MSIRDVVAMRTDLSANGNVGEYRNTHRPIRLGIWVLLVGFGGFLLWAAFAPLDEGVPSQATVSIATKRKVVESLRGGKIEKVYIREGQMVREGDILMKLDSQTAKARYDEIHQHYLGTRANADRLLAEMRIEIIMPRRADGVALLATGAQQLRQPSSQRLRVAKRRQQAAPAVVD